MKSFFVAILFLFISFNSFAQETNKSIKAGEKLTYTASYNMSGLLTQLAEVTMQTKEVKTKKSTLLHLKCKATTYSKWDSFFKIRDLYEAYVNSKTLKPVLYKRDIFEGGYIKKMKYTFNYGKRSVKSTMTKRNNIPQKKNLKIGAETRDVVSFLYRLRNFDIHKAAVGQSNNFTILFDNKEVTVTLTYLGKETVKAGNLGRKQCYKIAVGAKTDALKGKNNNIIWLTADDKKIPALITFNIPVGTGRLTLTNASGI